MTDHSAVKAVLETPSPNGKHARWWTKVFESGVGEVNIVYCLGKEYISADTLSRQPYLPAPNHGIAEYSLQVAPVTSANTSDPEETSIQNLFFTLIRKKECFSY